MVAKKMTKLVDLFSIDKETLCEYCSQEKLNTGVAGYSCYKDAERKAIAWPCEPCTKEDYDNCPMKNRD